MITRQTNKTKRTRPDNSIDEVFPRDESVVILIHPPEQICESGLLVVHELQELQVERLIWQITSGSTRERTVPSSSNRPTRSCRPFPFLSGKPDDCRDCAVSPKTASKRVSICRT